MKLLAPIVCLVVAQHTHASYLPFHLNNLESLLLRRMNFTADPCNDFYNYVCGNFDDSNYVVYNENTRILEAGLNELVNSKEHELLASSAIQKAVNYYGSCVKERDYVDIHRYIRQKIHTFSDMFDLPLDFFIQGDPNLWIDRQKWTQILKHVHDEFGVEPFFTTSTYFHKHLYQKPISESMTYFGIFIENLAFDEENTPNKYSCENRENLLYEYETTILNIIDILRLTVPTDGVEKIARSMMEIEFKLKYITCDETDEVVENESQEAQDEEPESIDSAFRKLSELRRENWPFDITDYVKEIIATGAGDFDVDYKNLTIYIGYNMPDFLSDIFEGTSDVDLLKYVYFRAIHKITMLMEPVTYTDCITLLHDNLLPLKSRIHTEFRYPSVWERESVRHITTVMVKAIKNELQTMMKSLPWVQKDEATLENLMSKLKELKANVVIELNMLNNTWIDTYYDQLKIGEGNSFLEMHYEVQRFHMYSKVQQLFATAEPFDDKTSPSYYYHINTFSVPVTDYITPMFNLKFPLSYNMGLLGSTIGHEITHAFDTNGVDYDETGAYNPMLSESAKQSMNEMADCVINYYDKLDVVIDKNNVTHVNGSKTVAENVADIGGVDAAYRAFKTMERSFGHDKQLRHPQLRRLTHDQLFFIGFTNYFCEKRDLARDYEIIKTDPHTPNLPRVRGTLANLPAFAKAYQCPAGSAYAPLEPCKVWTV
uniref:Neprilysin n=1 Tax=Panagrellus redivivus TaxID=6233 RepID=A0A7E4VKM1_PANRE